jgi:hypothetical protein
MLRLFDFPDPNATIDARMTTTVPLQQLFVLNSDYMRRQAKAFAARLNAPQATSDADKVQLAFQLAFNRMPSPDELALAIRFIGGPQQGGANATVSTISAGSTAPEQRKPEPMTRWEQYAQVLLSSNEFMYID